MGIALIEIFPWMFLSEPQGEWTACEVQARLNEFFSENAREYYRVFSWNHLDCGEAREFCHRMVLTDDRPFRLPYSSLSPAHYQKLKETLDEMKENETIMLLH